MISKVPPVRLEVPDTGRATIVENDGSVHVTVVPRRNWLIIGFLGFWLVGWAIGEVSVIGVLIVGAAFGQVPVGEWLAAAGILLFLLAFLGAWTMGGVVAFASFAWGIWGREHISLAGEVLSVERRIPFWTRRRDFDMGAVRRLRVAPQRHSIFDAMGGVGNAYGFILGFGSGTIQFDYGLGTRAFGLDLDEAEATRIVEVLAGHASA